MNRTKTKKLCKIVDKAHCYKTYRILGYFDFTRIMSHENLVNLTLLKILKFASNEIEQKQIYKKN